MNYIAHLHTAEHTQTSLLGSFLGDFVKGSQLGHLPKLLQIGVTLHRKVDVYTDAHLEILALKSNFPGSIRKMSGVVLDIYFDHLLMTHWHHFSTNQVSKVLARFYQELSLQDLTLSARFEMVKKSLLSHQWLEHYSHAKQCHAAFLSIEKRLGGKIQFADASMRYVAQNHTDIEQAFLRFYPQLLDYSSNFVADLS